MIQQSHFWVDIQRKWNQGLEETPAFLFIAKLFAVSQDVEVT